MDAPTRTVRARRPIWTALAVATTLSVWCASATTVHADGLDVTSETTYTVNPEAVRVVVESTLTIRNVTQDRVEGGRIFRSYYTGFTVPAPADVSFVSATQNGQTLDTSFERDARGRFGLINISLARNLFSGSSATIKVAYAIDGAPPRSDDPTRVNPAYSAFWAYGIGDPGQVTVSVVVPDGFDVETIGADVERTEGFGVIVYKATNIRQPEQFEFFVSARDDDKLVGDAFTAGGAQFRMQSWPGDDSWAAFTERTIVGGLPTLEELIGVPWPLTGTTEVREAYTPYLYGYAGWFNRTGNEIEIGENFDDETVLHELSHAWFNDTLFDERWVNEGLAQEYADRVLAERGGATCSPRSSSVGPFCGTDPKDVRPDDPGAQRLSSWGSPRFDVTDAEIGNQEAFGYNASWYVIDAILDEIGPEAMSKVLVAATERQLSYPNTGGGTDDPYRGTRDWRRFFDLVERLGGSTAAEQLLEDYVLVPSEATALPLRRDTIALYDGLAARTDWSVPEAIRVAMTDWQFGDATDLIASADVALAAYDGLQQRADDLDVELPASLRESYERAGSDAELVALSTSISTADERLSDLRALRERADTAGLTTSGDDVALIAAGDFDGLGAWIDDNLAAIERIEAAQDANDGATSFTEKIGLIGTDLDATLADAATALSDGDLERATKLAGDVESARADAAGKGKVRLLIALGIILVVTLAAVLLLRRRRTRARRATEPAEGDIDLGGPTVSEPPDESPADD